MSVRSWFPDEVDADVYGLPLVLSPGFNVSISLFSSCAPIMCSNMKKIA